MIVVGTTERALTVSNLSSSAKFGKNSATTSNGVDDSIRSTNSTYDAGTSPPNASSSVATIATERPPPPTPTSGGPTTPPEGPTRRSPSTPRAPRASTATSRWASTPPTVEGSIG